MYWNSISLTRFVISFNLAQICCIYYKWWVEEIASYSVFSPPTLLPISSIPKGYILHLQQTSLDRRSSQEPDQPTQGPQRPEDQVKSPCIGCSRFHMWGS